MAHSRFTASVPTQPNVQAQQPPRVLERRRSRRLPWLGGLQQRQLGWLIAQTGRRPRAMPSHFGTCQPKPPRLDVRVVESVAPISDYPQSLQLKSYPKVSLMSLVSTTYRCRACSQDAGSLEGARLTDRITFSRPSMRPISVKRAEVGQGHAHPAVRVRELRPHPVVGTYLRREEWPEARGHQSEGDLRALLRIRTLRQDLLVWGLSSRREHVDT